jgi:hypothetical protein
MYARLDISDKSGHAPGKGDSLSGNFTKRNEVFSEIWNFIRKCIAWSNNGFHIYIMFTIVSLATLASAKILSVVSVDFATFVVAAVVGVEVVAVKPLILWTATPCQLIQCCPSSVFGSVSIIHQYRCAIFNYKRICQSCRYSSKISIVFENPGNEAVRRQGRISQQLCWQKHGNFRPYSLKHHVSVNIY